MKQCSRCGSPKVALLRKWKADGDYLVAWYCEACKNWATNPPVWLTHKKADELLEQQGLCIEDIRIYEEEYIEQKCVVCGEPAEIHHWAPRALFPESFDKWPTSLLCPYHHKQWHELVTPYFCRNIRKANVSR